MKIKFYILIGKINWIKNKHFYIYIGMMMKERISIVEHTWRSEKGEEREEEFHASDQTNIREKEWDASFPDWGRKKVNV